MLAWLHPALQARVHVCSLVPRPPLDPPFLFGGGSGNETSVAILQAERYRGISWGNPTLSFSNSQSAGIYDETWLVGNYGLLLLNSSAITINNCV